MSLRAVVFDFDTILCIHPTNWIFQNGGDTVYEGHFQYGVGNDLQGLHGTKGEETAY